MRIGILTTFYNWDRAYSLVTVVEEQLKSLLENGYEPVLFVHDNFNADHEIPKGVEIRKVIPRFQLADYSQGQPPEAGFEEQATAVKEALLEHLKDIDAVFTHDWIFQGWFLVYNVGMRQAAQKLKCRWYHWVHSAPSGRPERLTYPHDCRYKLMPNSKMIYMNHTDALRLAEMYAGGMDDVRVVFNSGDIRSFYQFDPFVENLIKKYNLLEKDIIQVYPLSTTRIGGKQADKVIRLLAEMKKQGKSVAFICPNAHANAEREKQVLQNLIDKAIKWGLTREEVIFTSLEGKEHELGIPRKWVDQLFSISNLFMFPTLSENCPLILLQAAASKCLLVLNDDFPPLKDFFGKDALYFKFSSLLVQTDYSDENRWYHDVALIILAELNKNKPLNSFNTLKQKFNRTWIFKNQLEPILHELWEK